MARERYAVGSYGNRNNRSVRSRIFTVVLIFTAIVLLVLARSKHPLVGNVRTGLLDTATPVVEFVSTPITGIRALIRDKNMLFSAYDENKQLREEADKLRHWQSVAQALKAENDALRSLAGYQPVDEATYVTARVVGQAPGGYGSSIMLNAGSVEGVKTAMPVVDAYGMIGRITDVAEHSARVLLLSDSASRIPVVTADARVHAILAGGGSGDELMRMTFLGTENENIKVGEQVVTTEEAGLIPGGIIIGTVFRRDAQGLVVKPLRPLAQSEYVRVVVAKKSDKTE